MTLYRFSTDKVSVMMDSRGYVVAVFYKHTSADYLTWKFRARDMTCEDLMEFVADLYEVKVPHSVVHYNIFLRDLIYILKVKVNARFG